MVQVPAGAFMGAQRGAEEAAAFPLGTVFGPQGGYGLLASATAAQFALTSVACYIPENAQLTGIQVMNGAAVAGNVAVAIWNGLGTAPLAVSNLVTAQAGTNAWQAVPFVASYLAIPGLYYISVFNNNAAAAFQTAAPGSPAVSAVQGSFVFPATITLPAALTTRLAIPLMATY